MIQLTKKKKRFEEEGSEVLPARNRPFRLKQANPELLPDAAEPAEPKDLEPPEAPEAKGASPLPPPTTDAEGLQRAYDSPTDLYLDPQGTLHVSGTKGGFFGDEWMENYRYFGPGLVSKFGGMFAGMLSGVPTKGAGESYDVEAMGRYKELDDFMRAHPGQVKNFTGHSKGAAVVDKWMKNHPEFKGRARLYNTPYEDITASEGWKDRFIEARKDREDYYKGKFWGPSWLGDAIKNAEDAGQNFLETVTGLDKVKGMKERGEQRFVNEYDPASILDTSATVFQDPDWWKKAGSGFGHDYHNIAKNFAGFEPGKEMVGTLPARGIRGIIPIMPDSVLNPPKFDK